MRASTLGTAAIVAVGTCVVGLSLPRAGQAATPGPVVDPDYSLSVFAADGNKAVGTYYKPDSVTAGGGSVYVGYQDDSTATGGGHSTLVRYTSGGGTGTPVASLSGRCDGMRFNPADGTLWALFNEDANPYLAVITNPATAPKVTTYTFPTPRHDGGFDDLAFMPGGPFISASNPALNGSARNGSGAQKNQNPAVYRISIAGGSISLTPILDGNAIATDAATGSRVHLDLTDPDSLSIDSAGDLVLVDQGDAQVIYIHNPGAPGQSVVVQSVATQLDDTVWASSPSGRLLIADSKAGAGGIVYQLTRSGGFAVGTAYTQAPGDSTVPSTIGILDAVQPTFTIVGFKFGSPTGLLFVP